MVGERGKVGLSDGAARARPLADMDKPWAKTGAGSRTRAARRLAAIARWSLALGAEEKSQAAKHPGCGTSGAEWKEQAGGRGL